MSIHAKKSPALDGVAVNVSTVSARGAFLFNGLITYAEARKLRDELSLALADETTRIQCRICRNDASACSCAATRAAKGI